VAARRLVLGIWCSNRRQAYSQAVGEVAKVSKAKVSKAKVSKAMVSKGMVSKAMVSKAKLDD
jgi:hypothetical protein